MRTLRSSNTRAKSSGISKNKIPKMPASIIEKIISAFGSLQTVCDATVAELDDVDGIGERRAKIINQSLKRLQEQNIIKLYNM